MKPSLHQRLQELRERHEELGRLLAEPEVLGNPDRLRELSREYARLEPVVENFNAYEQLLAQHHEAEVMREDADAELRQLAAEELLSTDTRLQALAAELRHQLLPRDPHDDNNVFLEIRAGTGGDEAALFAGDLFRMYSRYAETRGWRVEILSESPGEQGGYREIISRVSGESVYASLKFESGAHRVQRVPQTESQGRIHTSACTVAVLPEIEQEKAADINPSELRIDTYRASGAGGQHVNKTDSAVRITHLPSGIVVECQDERSQHKNRARAMSLLQARLVNQARESAEREQADTRRSLVGSGDRSERIRTYNFPQGRVTDHRINLTLHRLEDILQGDLEPLLETLVHEYQSDQLAELGV